MPTRPVTCILLSASIEPAAIRLPQFGLDRTQQSLRRKLRRLSIQKQRRTPQCISDASNCHSSAVRCCRHASVMGPQSCQPGAAARS